jgi:hypothetical protein
LKRFATLVLFLSIASTVQASGVGLRWGSCEGASNRNFACDRSSGSELLVGSFQPPGGINQLSGIEVILSVSAGDGKVPTWWQTIEAGACRRGGISASFDVSDQTECDDPWSGAATGGMGGAATLKVSRYNFGDPSGLALWLTAAVPQNAIQAVQSGTKYAAFKLIINHQKSNGASACSGCDTPVCIRLDGIRLVQPGRLQSNGARPESYVDLTDGIGGMGGASQVVTWQGGTSNCAAGLAKPSTWSELKSRFKTK